MKKGHMIQESHRKAFLWNMAGGLMNAGSSFILLLLVTRIVGPYKGGMFSIGYATSQLALTVGWFGVRGYQVTDLHEAYVFKDYHGLRILTCIGMNVFTVVICAFNRYSGEKLWVVFLLTVYKTFDAYADVLEGYLQQHECLDLAGKSLLYRTTQNIIVFATSIYITQNLIFSIITLIASSFVGVLVYSVPFVKRQTSLSFRIKKSPIKGLIKACMPLFMGLFLQILINNIPKYAIDYYHTEEMQAYYNIIFMPALVITMFSGFVFRPLLTSLANYWDKKEYKKFNAVLYIPSVVVIIVLVLALGIGLTIGIPILSWLYNVDIFSFKKELVIILIGGSFYAIASMLYYMLITMRKQNSIYIGYGITLGAALSLTPIAVKKLGILGATISYALTMWILLLSLASFYFFYLNKVNFVRRKKDK